MQRSYVQDQAACLVWSSLVGKSRSSCRYEGSGRDDGPLTARLRELAAERRRFGYRRLHVLLQREDWAVNHKRVAYWYGSNPLEVAASWTQPVPALSGGTLLD